ncbi:carboxypeptidase-like regulatory domain-containing protein [Chitinophaga pendula]|uniref:carboxypeptidase-like regulatory domain-containing protein n=1 Tax=Chitinophaga TaxID=79328 RepID=UPI000BB070E9|nr:MULTISPECIES: carboxypeptidase-like regulatory domain-containing protein [Chitinophaga]ASZ11530.1 hypothetical protein CK934_11470 [Chitinophaga sp. MD30]UCJ05458.1 carboxypeptidase-like regulatory domain-containing protein [Chitinophaga pendula]
MKIYASVLAVVLLMAVQTLKAQVTVTGIITDKDNKLILPYATVINKTTGKRSFSDKGGFYKVIANRNDVLIFNFLGYSPDSITVVQNMGTETRDVQLTVGSKFLRSVEVSSKYSPYQLDSIARREQYGYILDKSDVGLIGGNGNTPEGAGITISPITRFSRKEKQKREFKKNFEKAEQEKYVDSRFTPLLVSQVTGLKGDSLLYFMRDNHPDYNTMRTIQRHEDLLYYITDLYKAWLQRPPKKK